ncbi:ATP-binding protein [Candidatus Dojkabacteria bacterium]|nr:ATP-binding protein [Candidatus Dojkabacteria bacterium]
MKEIAVTGGKGGTGKSTVAIMFAFKQIELGKKVLLVDCDVECPNDHILLGINELKNPVSKTTTFYPVIDDDKCTKCGLCVRSCRSSALFQPGDSVPVLNKDLCSSCGVCWNVCPSNAISKEEVVNGEIFRNDILDGLTLVTGRSIPGVRETSPVVEQVRDYIDGLKSSFDLVVIDTAAGAHCTVMRALEDVEKAYSVTEPTPLGAHDLSVILRVLKVLKVPSDIVLNRSDIGNKALIDEVARKHGSNVCCEIPYDDDLARFYSEGNFLEHRLSISKLLKLYKSQ